MNRYAPLDKVCLLGLRRDDVGIGAVHNTKQAQRATPLLFLPQGGIGLAAAQGAVQAKAGRILASTRKSGKIYAGGRNGATDFINPNDYDKTESKTLLLELY